MMTTDTIALAILVMAALCFPLKAKVDLVGGQLPQNMRKSIGSHRPKILNATGIEHMNNIFEAPGSNELLSFPTIPNTL